MAELVKCASCGDETTRKSARGIYVESFGVQYVCKHCRTSPFDEVMDGLRTGTVYVRGTAYENITELERAKLRDKAEGVR